MASTGMAYYFPRTAGRHVHQGPAADDDNNGVESNRDVDEGDEGGGGTGAYGHYQGLAGGDVQGGNGGGAYGGTGSRNAAAQAAQGNATGGRARGKGRARGRGRRGGRRQPAQQDASPMSEQKFRAQWLKRWREELPEEVRKQPGRPPKMGRYGTAARDNQLQQAWEEYQHGLDPGVPEGNQQAGTAQQGQSAGGRSQVIGSGDGLVGEWESD